MSFGCDKLGIFLSSYSSHTESYRDEKREKNDRFLQYDGYFSPSNKYIITSTKIRRSPYKTLYPLDK